MGGSGFVVGSPDCLKPGDLGRIREPCGGSRVGFIKESFSKRKRKEGMTINFRIRLHRFSARKWHSLYVKRNLRSTGAERCRQMPTRTCERCESFMQEE